MVIDKNLLSKKSGQESANELFSETKVRLIKAREQFENLIANHQTIILENIDEIVKRVLHNYNSRGNTSDTITFDVLFSETNETSVWIDNSYEFGVTLDGHGATYKLNGNYSYFVSENIVNTSQFSKEELNDMSKNCRKYLDNVLIIDEISVNSDNKISIFVNLNDYLIKAAHDFSQLVVAYLAKQGIKSRANQSYNKVTVIIERDTDTGGFEDI